jgi:copper chaperone
MKEYTFKTNINCGSCIRSVTGFIEEVPGLQEWRVDTENPEKILTVKGDNLSKEAVVEAVEDAGFDIEPVAQSDSH